MPIQRIPITHKFGIISQSHRQELQERILESAYQETLESRKHVTTTGNPFEVTEAFIEEFNSADTLDEQDKYQKLARSILERVKRRAGLKSSGAGGHVDLPLAWTELMQLAACRGKIQEECLDCLVMSLDQSPLTKPQIPALFFLAESTLYWLRTESINTPYLRTAELKLLKVGMLVFNHLYYHHMSSQLNGHEDFKTRLFTYLDGFADCQEAYSPYPNALLYIRYINDVGNMIIGDAGLELKNNTTYAPKNYTMQEQTRESPACEANSPSSHSAGGVSSSVHDLSPTLWHSLDVWRCVYQRGGGLQDALAALSVCGMGLANESWIDTICALQILADAAKTNLQTLIVMQDLARGIASRQPAIGHEEETDRAPPTSNRQQRDASATTKTSILDSSKIGLSDIVERTEYTSTYSGRNGKPSSGSTRKTDLDWKSIKHDEEDESVHEQPEMIPEEPLPKTFTQESLGLRQQTGLSGWKADYGSEGRRSQASSAPTYGNQIPDNVYGLHGWRWEVALIYTDMLASVCLHSSTSNIFKVALLGRHKDTSMLHRSSCTYPMNSAALLDLLYFHAQNEIVDGGRNDWSWRIRYEAMEGLVKMYHCLEGKTAKEGLRNVAWAQLKQAHRSELDRRVLEAFQIGQVDANLENTSINELDKLPNTLGSRMAKGLAKLYLPPLPSPVILEPPKPRSPPKHPAVHKPVMLKPLRTSLKEEISLATALYEPPVSYEARSSFDLRRIVEDQWRKELQLALEKEEDTRKVTLNTKQQEKEKGELKRILSKSEKLNRSTVASLRKNKASSNAFIPSILNT